MKPLEDELTYKQPEKCERCIWGEWTGTKQWCSKRDGDCVRKNMIDWNVRKGYMDPGGVDTH